MRYTLFSKVLLRSFVRYPTLNVAMKWDKTRETCANDKMEIVIYLKHMLGVARIMSQNTIFGVNRT